MAASFLLYCALRLRLGFLYTNPKLSVDDPFPENFRAHRTGLSSWVLLVCRGGLTGSNMWSIFHLEFWSIEILGGGGGGGVVFNVILC